MKKVFTVFIILSFLLSCKKTEKSDLIWEKTFGNGEAYFIKTSADSGITACGQTDGKPYFLRLDKDKKAVIDFTYGSKGIFSSVWSDNSGYIAGGSSGGKILLAKYNPEGSLVWEKSPDAGFRVDYTTLFYTGNGNLLAIGTSGPDSLSTGATGIYFIKFDTTGHILLEKKIPAAVSFYSVKAETDNSGNIYLPVTRKTTGSKSKACVVKYNADLNKLWETEIFNNPSFSSACYAIIPVASGKVYVSGRTELPVENGTVSNSFIVCLNSNGSFSADWKEKKYPEYSNEGYDIVFDKSGNLLMLNRKCMIINYLNPADGSNTGLIRTFSLCVPENTDAFGNDLVTDHNDNLLLAGSLGGNFYLGIKASK